MLALLAMLPLAASPSDLPRFDGALVHRVQIQTIGGSGGPGGNVPIIINGGTIILNPQGGSGGSGGNAIGNPGPGATPPLVTRMQGVVSSVISKCSLKIAGETVVSATGCNFDKSDGQIRFRAPSETTDYTMRVVYNSDKTAGQGWLSSAKTPRERDLGTLVPRGPCWLSTDSSVEICGWK